MDWRKEVKQDDKAMAKGESKGCYRNQSSSNSIVPAFACLLLMEKWHAHSNESTLQCVRTLAKTPRAGPVAVAVGEAGRKPEKPGING